MAFARRLISNDDLRARTFRGRHFTAGDWRILLELFVATEEGRRSPVTALTNAPTIAKSTALNRIAEMIDAGILLREADPGDGRRFFISLAPEIHPWLNEALAEMARSDEPPAPE
ncbi:hypothetical protein [Sphingomonas oryzagri]